jgi:hypothetical protein
MSSFEHRKHPRRRHRQTAWIETSNGPVECSIVDISENGARIRHPLTDIEIQFTLRLSEDGKVARECCVGANASHSAFLADKPVHKRREAAMTPSSRIVTALTLQEF